MKIVKLQSLLLALAMALSAVASFADTDAGVMNANTATAQEIASLPHMDDIMADVVISNRPFVTIGEMDHLLSSDLGEDELEDLYGRLFVPINLNTATRSDILLIPGLG